MTFFQDHMTLCFFLRTAWFLTVCSRPTWRFTFCFTPTWSFWKSFPGLRNLWPCVSCPLDFWPSFSRPRDPWPFVSHPRDLRTSVAGPRDLLTFSSRPKWPWPSVACTRDLWPVPGPCDFLPVSLTRDLWPNQFQVYVILDLFQAHMIFDFPFQTCVTYYLLSQAHVTFDLLSKARGDLLPSVLGSHWPFDLFPGSRDLGTSVPGLRDLFDLHFQVYVTLTFCSTQRDFWPVPGPRDTLPVSLPHDLWVFWPSVPGLRDL